MKTASLLTFACAILFMGCARQIPPQESDPMDMNEAQSAISTLIGMEGYNTLDFAAEDSDYQITVAKDEYEGVLETFVLVIYPFKKEAQLILTELGIAVPERWEVRDFELKEHIEYTVTGSTPESIAQFVDNVFTKLFKEKPVLHGPTHHR